METDQYSVSPIIFVYKNIKWHCVKGPFRISLNSLLALSASVLSLQYLVCVRLKSTNLFLCTIFFLCTTINEMVMPVKYKGILIIIFGWTCTQVVGNGFCSSVVEHWSSNPEDAGSIPSWKALELHFSQLVPVWVL